MPQTRILPRSFGLAVPGSQVYKEHCLWQNRAYRAPRCPLSRRAHFPSD